MIFLISGSWWVRREDHDTISMVAIDAEGNIAAGSSSNGANHKVLFFLDF